MVGMDGNIESQEPVREPISNDANRELSDVPSTEVTGADAGGDGNTPPEYVPNRKYKFSDPEKGDTEAEFDEWVNPYLSKDSEDKFRDLFSKAKGVDLLKADREKVRAQRAAVEQEYAGFKQNVQEVLSLKDKDLGIFCDRIGLSRPQLAKWLLTQLEAEEKLKDLPEPLRNMYTEVQELKKQNLELTKTLSGTQSSGLQAATQALTYEVNTVMAKPEIAALVTEYDTRRGKPGAFYQQVVREGELEHARTGKDIPAGEAVNRALETLALQLQAPSQGATPNGQGAAPKTVVVQQTKPATIPNVGNGTAAATNKRPRSVDDLRKLAKEFSARA